MAGMHNTRPAEAVYLARITKFFLSPCFIVIKNLKNTPVKIL